MSGTNDFLPFATGGGANVESQGSYAVDSQLTIGNQPGIARSSFVNKSLRQACYIASQIAQFLVNQTGQNCLDDATPANIQALMNQVWPSPTGTILAFAGASVPVGFLMADGSSQLRSAYPVLFGVIGTLYGSVDGTHFNLPDAQGIFLRGAGTQTMGGVPYTAVLGTIQADAFQGHFQAANSSSTVVASGGTFGYLEGNNNGGVRTPDGAVLQSDGVNGTPRIAGETRPAAIGVNFIIKT